MKRYEEEAEGANFWPAFTDVMSTIVLVFFFLILLAYFQQIISMNVWDKKLDAIQDELNRAGIELQVKEQEISLKEDTLRDMSDEAQKLKLDAELTLQQMREQEGVITDSNRELATLRNKISAISTIRLDLIKEIKVAIEDELGYAKDTDGNEIIELGPNANLIINTNLLFGVGSSQLTYDGRQFVDNLASAFENVLSNKNNMEMIASINIEGHADARGDYIDNYNLSSNRASRLISYMMEQRPRLKRNYASIFAAVGYSEFRPYNGGLYIDDREDPLNRRIEISVSIKDSQFKSILEDYLNN